MATASRGSSLSREEITASYLAVKDEERREKVRKADLVDAAALYVTVTELPGRALDLHTDLSVAPRLRLPTAVATVPPGIPVEVGSGDRHAKPPAFRPASREECEKVAAGRAATIRDYLHFVEAKGPVTTAEVLALSVKHEVERAQRAVEEAKRQVADLSAALAIAESRAEEARSGFERFFEGKPEQFRAAVVDLAQRLESPPPVPAQERELPRTVADLRRLESGDSGARSFRAGVNGPEPLIVSRS